MMQLGDRVLSYILERELGEGGMGTVYLGQHTVLNQQVAIKALSPLLARDQALRERFIQEANIQAGLRHPGIVQVLTADMESEQPSLVMEYIDGKSLAEVLVLRGALPIDDAIKIMEQVFSAVGYAHKQGVIHRDLKPSNVMVLASGEAKVTDFGIAKVLGSTKLTRTGTAMGSAHYMSPEQIRRPETVDARSDIYSLGCVFYEVLTGRPPFGEKDTLGTESDFEIKEGHVRGQIPLPRTLMAGIPEWLESVVMQSLEKEPAQRQSSCEVILEQIKSSVSFPSVRPIEKTVLFTPEPPIIVEGDSVETPAPPQQEKNETRSTSKILAAVVILAVVGWSYIYPSTKEEAAPPEAAQGTGQPSSVPNKNKKDLASPTARNQSQAKIGSPDDWIKGQLYGHDNHYASLRKVSIFEEGGQLKVLIANQFGFKCGIEFDYTGKPARLTGCESTTDPDWVASPSVIPLKCREAPREQICVGRYTLKSANFGEEDNMVIARKK